MTLETGCFCWFDFGTTDANKAMAFYNTVLGWTFESMGTEYWMIKVGKDTIGGIRKESTTTFKPAEGFQAYFIVPSCKEARSVVTKAGGKLQGETVAIGEHGHFQLFHDLDGNRLSLWSQKP